MAGKTVGISVSWPVNIGSVTLANGASQLSYAGVPGRVQLDPGSSSALLVRAAP